MEAHYFSGPEISYHTYVHRTLIIGKRCARIASGGAHILADLPEENSFPYDSYSKADVAWLKQAAISLRVSLRRNVKEIIEIGSLLTKARRRLGQKQWQPWLKREVGIPARSASRLLAVADVFGGIQPEVLERFTPTALYTLAEPGVPKSLREYCVEQARENSVITEKIVTEWLGAYRENPNSSALISEKGRTARYRSEQGICGRELGTAGSAAQ